MMTLRRSILAPLWCKENKAVYLVIYPKNINEICNEISLCFFRVNQKLKKYQSRNIFDQLLDEIFVIGVTNMCTIARNTYTQQHEENMYQIFIHKAEDKIYEA